MFWRDDFNGNKLDSKWVPITFSVGGQFTGTFTRDIRDSKIGWLGAAGNTESDYWGDKISLPVNATGDIIITANMRERSAVQFGGIGIGVNNPSPPPQRPPRYGMSLAGNLSQISGWNNYAITPWPAMPSKTYLNFNVTDYITEFKIVRKNGYIFLYIGDKYVGSFAYATTISTVDITASWYQAGHVNSQKWVDYVEIWPREVVL